MKENTQELAQEEKQVFTELGESPFKKFKEAFALMSIIPFLVFFYILVGKLFSISILEGEVGLILSVIIIIAIFGFLVSYSLIRNLIRTLISYSLKLKRYDSAKSEFVTKFSHEVLTPLTVMKINMSNATDGIYGAVNDSLKKSLFECNTCVERIERLVSTMLDLSRIEAGRLELQRVRINIADLLNGETVLCEPLASKKNVKIVREIPKKAITIWGDPDRFKEVILNLLDNAIKYTPHNGSVTVKLKEDPHDVVLEVIDTGPGISTDRLEKVFDKFANISDKKGHGLGLSITRDIVDLHKGRIWVESALGKGSKFIVLLPKDLRLKPR